MVKIITGENISIIREPFLIDKRELYINKLLIIGRMMAEGNIYNKELSEEYIKTDNALEEYSKKIIEEHENKMKPKYHSFNTKDKKYGEGDNVEEAMNKRTRLI